MMIHLVDELNKRPIMFSQAWRDSLVGFYNGKEVIPASALLGSDRLPSTVAAETVRDNA